ncbi:CIC11C00000005309 [Sungouiella intermedia]|uniref:CIC11C00000005309 n=1 Tax=Sungouiella intermedia TaxID=45354 RepID=A0A1L0D2N3_9ASCO|nr:CIC11C00000005309 [[Candida] intermedia]
MTSVFLTGATGYIGGEVLYQLLTHGGYNVTALVRTDAKAQLLSEKTSGAVKTVIGNLDDLDTINTQVDAADVIINTANVDHVPSAQVMAKALAKKTKKTIFIHTSGTSVVGDEISSTKGPSTIVYSDVKSIDEINSLPDTQLHRPVEKIVLNIEEQNPNVKTVIISPSTIFGKSRGYDNLFSAQIPYLVELTKKYGKPFTVYLGDYIWSHAHIHDLGDLYYLILERLLADESIPTGKKGYYFVSYTDSSAITNSPSEIEHSWKDIAVHVGKILKEKGEIQSNEVEELSEDEIITFSGNPFAPLYWGANSRTRGDNGIKIGWKPKYSSRSKFLNSIEADVDHVLSK